METLIAMKEEYKKIVNDIKLHPDHIHMYDLDGCMKEIENRCFIVSKKEGNVNIDGTGSAGIEELKGIDNIEEFERKGIIKLCKMNKNELLTLKTIVGTIFDIAISSK
ncbi:hypothetical protein [Vallitalea sp.]|jgi:hypothetical protein|uniref:hypothetical protein n=1 Tax=Vallitalea sp. TaxID=1882829 RepID=UPI0025D9D2EF|nr:hypothetical protein [Vallitalea sp.]MCT4687304.1 hypothetical protein [Vallitalea sp.]